MAARLDAQEHVAERKEEGHAQHCTARKKNICICVYVCIYAYMYTCIYVYMYICTYVHMYVCIYVYTYVCCMRASADIAMAVVESRHNDNMSQKRAMMLALQGVI